jgi:hypothetical protein
MKHVVDLVQELEKREIFIYVEPIKADVSIVLFGNFTNPLPLRGKRVLAYDASRWMPEVPVPLGWKMYEPILEEYYDEMIDLTGLTVPERADVLELTINQYQKA